MLNLRGDGPQAWNSGMGNCIRWLWYIGIPTGKPQGGGTKERGLSACSVRSLHVRGSSSTSDNLDQLSGNDSLSGTVEKNLVLVDHLAGVL